MSLGEFDLIQKYFIKSGWHHKDLVTGIGDDAAQVAIAGRDILIASLVLTEGSNFPAEQDPNTLGRYVLEKTLEKFPRDRAKPKWLTLALQIPDIDEIWLEGFSTGLTTLAEEHDILLIGGDTTRGELSICLHIFGNIVS
jgi:thiamine-monophosphate kinase